MKFTWIIIFCLCVSYDCFSQYDYNREIDSLQKILPKTKDTARVNTLNQIGHFYTLLNKPDKGIEYAEQALATARRNNWYTGIAKSFEVLAISYEYKSDVVTERQFYFKALEAARKAGEKKYIAHLYGELAINHVENNINLAMKYFDTSLRMYKAEGEMGKYYDVLVQMGGAFKGNGNLYRAAECFSQYLKYGEKVHDTARIVNGMMYLADIYAAEKNYVKAIDYYDRASNITGHKKNLFFQASVLAKKGAISLQQKKYQQAIKYYNDSGVLFDKVGSNEDKVSNRYMLALVYNEMNDKERASEYIDKAFQINESNPYHIGKMHGYILLGRASFAIEDYQSALKYHSKALTDAQQLGRYQETALAYGSIGAVELMLSKTAQYKRRLLAASIEHLKKSIAMHKEIQNYGRLQMFYNYLHQAYEQNNNFDEALAAYKQYVIYNDTIENKNKRDEFNAKQLDYEYAKKEALLKTNQEAAIKRERTMRNVSFAGLGVVFVLAGGAGMAYRRKRRDNVIIAREKKRSDDLLLNILPFEVARELKEKGEADAHYYEHVSILFTDFEGFTELSSNMSPYEVVSELNFCFKEFDRIISKYNIEKIKTIGDAYMAVSGVPASTPDHALNAVRAAIEIRDFIVSYREKRKQEGKDYFGMRVGINSGEVVAGIVGVKKFTYDVWGDAVNIAARMESNGVVGKINISESTFGLVKDQFDTEYRGEIEAKGKGKIKMYFVEPKTI